MTRSRVLASLRDALAAEAHVIASDPGLLRQQVCNRLDRRARGVADLRMMLDAEESTRREPWLRRVNAPRESDELARTIPAGQGGVVAAALLSPGHTLVTRGRDGTVATWDLRSGVRVAVSDGRPAGRQLELGADGADTDDRPTPLSFVESRTGRRLQVARDKRVLVVAPEGGDLRGDDAVYLAGHAGLVTCAALYATDDGRQLVVSGSEDATVRAWDPLRGDEVAVLVGHTSAISFVAQVPAGAWGSIVSTSTDDTIRLWRAPIESPGHRGVGHQGAVTAAAVSPDGGYAVTGGEDGAAVVWAFDAETPAWSSAGFRVAVAGVALDTGGKTVGIGLADGTGVLWDVGRDLEVQGGTWSRPVFDGTGFAVDTPAGRRRLVARHRLLGGTRWVDEAASAPAVAPARTAAEARGTVLHVGGCRFPCSARVTATAGDDRLGRFVAGDEQGNVYVLQLVAATQRRTPISPLTRAPTPTSPPISPRTSEPPVRSVGDVASAPAEPWRNTPIKPQFATPEPAPIADLSSAARIADRAPTSLDAGSPAIPQGRVAPSLVGLLADSGLAYGELEPGRYGIPFEGLRARPLVVQAMRLAGELAYLVIPLPEPGRHQADAARRSLLQVTLRADYVKAFVFPTGELAVACEQPLALLTPTRLRGLVNGLAALGDVQGADLVDGEEWERRLDACRLAHARIGVEPETALAAIRAVAAADGLPVREIGPAVLGVEIDPFGTGLPLTLVIRANERVVSLVAYLPGSRPKGDQHDALHGLLELNRAADVARVGLDTDGDVALLYEVPDVDRDLFTRLREQFAALLVGVVHLGLGR